MNPLAVNLILEFMLDGFSKEEQDKIKDAKRKIESIIFNENGSPNKSGLFAFQLFSTEMNIRVQHAIREAENEPDKDKADG